MHGKRRHTLLQASRDRSVGGQVQVRVNRLGSLLVHNLENLAEAARALQVAKLGVDARRVVALRQSLLCIVVNQSADAVHCSLFASSSALRWFSSSSPPSSITPSLPKKQSDRQWLSEGTVADTIQGHPKRESRKVQMHSAIMSMSYP
mmetsp:Transcript_28860/g.67474  ORF Transcript_28860/g.67474 Transcript_28860/m.67474 type:complete len:148 (-) Transcript_28860:1297-1740(-)